MKQALVNATLMHSDRMESAVELQSGPKTAQSEGLIDTTHSVSMRTSASRTGKSNGNLLSSKTSHKTASVKWLATPPTKNARRCVSPNLVKALM